MMDNLKKKNSSWMWSIMEGDFLRGQIFEGNIAAVKKPKAKLSEL